MAQLYYNGILLPEIPSSALATNPYAAIRKNESTGYYDLILAIQPFYYDVSEKRLIDDGGQTDLWYRISLSSASNATSWGSAQSHSYKGWTVDANRTVVWSNHDISIDNDSSLPVYSRASEATSFNTSNDVFESYEISGQLLLDIVRAVKDAIGLPAPLLVSDIPAALRYHLGIATTTASVANYSLRSSFVEDFTNG